MGRGLGGDRITIYFIYFVDRRLDLHLSMVHAQIPYPLSKDTVYPIAWPEKTLRG